MKTLIVYATRHGCTEEAAKRLAGKLAGETDLVNIKKDKVPKLDDYPAVIVGGSIHAGHIQGKVKNFLAANRGALQGKKLGLFLCCLEQGETAQKEFNSAFLAELRQKAKASGLFGGRLVLERMGWIERLICKMAKLKENIDRLDDAAIAAFADRWKSAL